LKGKVAMEIDLIFKIAGTGIIVAVLNLVLKRAEREEQAMMTTLAGLADAAGRPDRHLVRTGEVGVRAMIDETVTAAAVCITAAIFSTLLKQYCREHALFCVLGACAAVGIAAAAYLTPIVSQMQELFAKTSLPAAYLEILWKALGICYITGIAGDLCQDCGESALAKTVELWGRLSLVETLLRTVTEVLS